MLIKMGEIVFKDFFGLKFHLEWIFPEKNPLEDDLLPRNEGPNAAHLI